MYGCARSVLRKLEGELWEARAGVRPFLLEVYCLRDEGGGERKKWFNVLRAEQVALLLRRCECGGCGISEFGMRRNGATIKWRP